MDGLARGSAKGGSPVDADTRAPPPRQPPPSPGHSSGGEEADEYSRQSLTNILPPSRRSSLGTRPASSASTSASAPSPSTRDTQSPTVSGAAPTAVAAPEVRSSASWLVKGVAPPVSSGGAGGRDTAATNAMNSDAASSSSWPARTAASPVAAAAAAAAPTAPISFVRTHEVSSDEEAAAAAAAADDNSDTDDALRSAPASLIRSRLGDVDQQQQQHLEAHAAQTTALHHPPSSPPHPLTQLSSRSGDSHAQAAAAPVHQTAASLRGRSPSPLRVAVPPSQLDIVTPTTTTAHVRFSSDIDEVEAASQTSTSTITTAAAVHVHERRDGEDVVAVVASPTPALLSPDELQLQRVKVYDRVVHRSDGNDGDDGDGGGAVSTLDFLRDTTHTILPDAVNHMFASTSLFLRTQTEAVMQAVPAPLRKAASRAGGGLATVADMTGSMLSSMQSYAVRTVPDAVLSPEWKYLIFVDAINVLKCSWNVNILVAPYILRMGGLVGGVLLIALMQLLCCYYTEVFFAAKHQLRGAAHVIMYGDVPRMTFGTWYPTYQLWYDGVALVATVAYAALNMRALLPHMNIHGGAATALGFTVPLLLCLPLVFMKRASTQPPMLTLASLLIFVALVMMFAVFPYGNVVRATVGSLRNDGGDGVAILYLFPQSVSEFFVALSICTYTCTPLGTAVPVERTMSPRRYIVLLRVCAAVTAAVHIAFAVCTLVSYGSLTCSVLPTSFDNHHTPLEVGVISLLFVAFLLYIPLSLFELGELMDRRVLGWRTIPGYGAAGPNALRVLLLVGSAVVAYALPYYGLLLSLAGALGYAAVAVVVPAALDYVCRERRCLLRGQRLRLLDYLVSFGGVAFGAVIALVGMVFTLYQLWLVTQAGYDYAC
ncbi:Transmembrane amino acid transporter protein [Novymonas esmeraldas]|uniref:Transmembrane amino acid transporter protein n=1 Tax=Novymonas esmeraldas TaxID=1808958 RepID=A0AAW0ES59_9TRYP